MEIKDSMAKVVFTGTEVELSAANLSFVDLYQNDLSSLDLHYTDFYHSNLNCVDFSNSDLSYASLYHAYLYNSNFSNAILNWASHDLLSEIQRQESKGDIEKLKIAGLLLVLRDLCWRELLEINDPLKDWALESLAKYIQPNDNHPYILDEYVKQEDNEA